MLRGIGTYVLAGSLLTTPAWGGQQKELNPCKAMAKTAGLIALSRIAGMPMGEALRAAGVDRYTKDNQSSSILTLFGDGKNYDLVMQGIVTTIYVEELAPWQAETMTMLACETLRLGVIVELKESMGK